MTAPTATGRRAAGLGQGRVPGAPGPAGGVPAPRGADRAPLGERRPGGGVVAVGSVKGAPGVTVAVLALATAWTGAQAPSGRPGRKGEAGQEPPVVVVEADRSGGDLGVWYGLAERPGLGSWAAARPGPAPLAGQWQTLPAGPAAGLRVVVAPVGVAQTQAALDELSDTRALTAAAAGGVLVLADCGRIDPTTPPRADLLVLLTVPTPVELARLRASAATLTANGGQVGVLLAGEPAWPRDQVAEVLGLPVLGVLPYDPSTAAALTRTPGPGGRSRPARRSPLLSAAGEVVTTVRALLDHADDAQTGPHAGSQMQAPSLAARIALTSPTPPPPGPLATPPRHPPTPAAQRPAPTARPWPPASQPPTAPAAPQPGEAPTTLRPGGWVPLIEPDDGAGSSRAGGP
ncbi:MULTISPECIES: hypothetical protein [unclassified Frankia]|uniref:hypothetical protein n=1 Tax=unclassified Frankia TaxID=2632575 RepID=UPI001EE4E88A|nr:MULTISPECIES: hypothetical protein [unclassified Frankia]